MLCALLCINMYPSHAPKLEQKTKTKKKNTTTCGSRPKTSSWHLAQLCGYKKLSQSLLLLYLTFNALTFLCLFLFHFFLFWCLIYVIWGSFVCELTFLKSSFFCYNKIKIIHYGKEMYTRASSSSSSPLPPILLLLCERKFEWHVSIKLC